MISVSHYFFIITLLQLAIRDVQTDASPEDSAIRVGSDIVANITVRRDNLSQAVLDGFGEGAIAVGRWRLEKSIREISLGLEGNLDDFSMEIAVDIPVVVAPEAIGADHRVSLASADWPARSKRDNPFGGFNSRCIDTSSVGAFVSPEICGQRAFAASLIAFGKAEIHNFRCTLFIVVASKRTQELSLRDCRGDGLDRAVIQDIPVEFDDIIEIVDNPGVF